MDQYLTQYSDLHFERAGLFEVILKTFKCRDVLYPGCSVHITPSLFFPHVVYVDQSEWSRRFFAYQESILRYIKRHKKYKRSAYVRFIGQDYLQPLPLMDSEFDLLLALFAGGISQSCKQYLKPGGLLVTNNHQNDATEASRDEELRLISKISFRSGQYVIAQGGMDASKIPVQKSYKNALRQSSGSVEYIEHEIYYVFERTST